MPINKIDPKDIDAFRIALQIHPANLFDTYQRVSSDSAIYPGIGTVQGILYCGLKINGEAGELAEHLGKAMRDDGWVNGQPMTPERKDKVMKELGDILWYLTALCREFDVTLGQVAYMNLLKLRSRQVRDKLQGSGDDR